MTSRRASCLAGLAAGRGGAPGGTPRLEAAKKDDSSGRLATSGLAPLVGARRAAPSDPALAEAAPAATPLTVWVAVPLRGRAPRHAAGR
jgi:hypothetical protein